MPRGRVLALAAAALLLEALPLAVAHGSDHNDENMNMAHHEASASASDKPMSYWSFADHVGVIYAHIALMSLAWMVVLPIGVMFSVSRSRFALPAQFVFLVVNAFGMLFGIIYDRKTPSLYENNAHSKTGWIITWVASAWVFMALVQAYTGRIKAHSMEDQVAQPVSSAALAQYHRVQDAQLNFSRWSNDSGHGTERNSSSLCGHSRSPSVESENQQYIEPQSPYHHDDDEPFVDDDAEKRGFLRNTSVDRFLGRNISRLASFGRILKIVRFLYVVIDRTILIQGFVAFTSGTVVYGGIGRGGAVFNVLAHYVKGGIFFWYGLLTLGRWMGAFADFGWAWNMKPPKEVVGHRRAALPSAEFIESFVIFLYGCSNVFLEHLAAWGDAWTAQDLEHVSISIMFFGGGLLGMIVESRKMRDLLNYSIASVQDSMVSSESWQPPKSYRFSMNPMPGLIILLLGIMMSSHHQASMLSSMIHKQWGNMFVGFALARAVTYILMYLCPPTSYLPSRPPSEIITAFCLVAGGLTFMVSNKDTVAALESYGLDAMFTLTVTIGFTALLLAWTTVLIALKGWAVRKESKTPFAKRSAGALA